MTPAQLATLKTTILADPVLMAWPHTADGAFEIAKNLNATDISNTSVWWSAAPTDVIFNAITWTNYTPNDLAPTDTALNAATHQARTLVAQTKQMNLQNMLVGRQAINATYASIRSGLQDSVTQLPTGAAGAMKSAGGASGAALLTALIRPAKATRFEKIMSTGPQLTGTVTADVLSFEGDVGYTDILVAMSNAW